MSVHRPDNPFDVSASSRDTPDLAAERKKDHIRICMTEDVESHGEPARGGNPAPAGPPSEARGATPAARPFSRFRLLPEALPECDIRDVDTGVTFLGRRFSLPLLITGMTGGVERGQHINECLAMAAEKLDIPMGLGSQKIALMRPELEPLFDVRKKAPGVFLIGNIGGVSFNYGVGVDDVRRLVERYALGAFAVHLNALQECIQPEGERNFSGILRVLERLARELPVPVIVKEVGSGMTGATFARLCDVGVAAVDVGGSGGTSWSAIEGLRAEGTARRLGELFRNWGLATDESLQQCQAMRKKKGAHGVALIATGGIRDGLQAAKACALGADMVGIGLPLLRAATGLSPSSPSSRSSDPSLEAVLQELDFLRQGLVVSMFCSGARSLSQLQGRVFEVTHD